MFPQPRSPSLKVREFVNFLARIFAADSRWHVGSPGAQKPSKRRRRGTPAWRSVLRIATAQVDPDSCIMRFVVSF